MPVKATVLSAAEVGADELERWSRLQLDQPALASPFFHPEFTRAVASVRDDVRVAILALDGDAVGYFPFERGPGGIGRPVGGLLSDYHGAVVEPGARWDGAELVRACSLRSWAFTHVPAEQEPLAAFASARAGSPYLDLADGFEAYDRARRASGSKAMQQIGRAGRRLEKAHGRLTFTAQERDVATLHALLRLKSAQYERTGALDIFAARWIVALFERILDQRGSDFAGVLSTLRVDDRLVAAHFGMRSRHVWHYWIPAYDPAFGAFKPGLLLILEMARHAAAHGIRVLDLGHGGEDYKGRLASGSFPLAEGVITDSRLVTARQAVKRRADAAAKRSPAAAAALRRARTLKLRLEDRRRHRRGR